MNNEAQNQDFRRYRQLLADGYEKNVLDRWVTQPATSFAFVLHSETERLLPHKVILSWVL